ncbi:hypothetical protein BJP36_37380 [Moorena producens JHB]|uniref:Uncharacterized protein n=1 Tax=Moorena producens (strain JHB) TaxID=1454205 RepID=A0A9Q9UWE2_MOOP1|nr:hypothetical protein BJP36_37380 [Moorena producens JHB]
MRCTGFFSTPPSPCQKPLLTKLFPLLPRCAFQWASKSPLGRTAPYSLLPKTNVSGKIEP